MLLVALLPPSTHTCRTRWLVRIAALRRKRENSYVYSTQAKHFFFPTQI